MRRFRACVGVILVAVGIIFASGCDSRDEKPALQPTVKPPAIATAGVLRAGVDLATPPFAGTDKGQKAGIDVDIAAALAERLGLTLELVDVSPSNAATALADGRVDVVMSVPMGESALSSSTVAGTYLADGPAFFSNSTETVSLESLGDRRIAVQAGSLAYWLLQDELGDEGLVVEATLRAAFSQLASGSVDLVAGDALVGGYLIREFPEVRFSGQIGEASLIGVVVGPDSEQLAGAVRSALDALAADGVLDTVRSKWVGDLPELDIPTSLEESATP